MRPVITLTTDFGTRDPYAAAMKGVCLSVCREATVVDLSHEVQQHDVLECALFLGACFGDFPKGTIHCAVVDPGVGTARRPVVAQFDGQLIVCPDNGLVTRVQQRFGFEGAWRIENRECFAEEVSNTFHGRDVFALTAARLAAGMPPEAAGSVTKDLVTLPIAEPQERSDGTVIGEVIHVDRFGNLITNVDHKMLKNDRSNNVSIGDLSFEQVSTTYGDAMRGEPLALVGGSGLLEIAVNFGSAADNLGLGRGEKVRVSI